MLAVDDRNSIADIVSELEPSAAANAALAPPLLAARYQRARKVLN